MLRNLFLRGKYIFYKILHRLGLISPGKIMYIGGSDTLPPPLRREEEAELLRRLDEGEEQVRADPHRTEPAPGCLHCAAV